MSAVTVPSYVICPEEYEQIMDALDAADAGLDGNDCAHAQAKVNTVRRVMSGLILISPEDE